MVGYERTPCCMHRETSASQSTAPMWMFAMLDTICGKVHYIMRNAYNVWLTKRMINKKGRRKNLSLLLIYNYILCWVIPVSDGTLFCNLFNNSLLTSKERGSVILNWKEAVIAYFKVLSQYLHRNYEVNHENLMGTIFLAKNRTWGLLNVKYGC